MYVIGVQLLWSDLSGPCAYDMSNSTVCMAQDIRLEDLPAGPRGFHKIACLRAWVVGHLVLRHWLPQDPSPWLRLAGLWVALVGQRLRVE